MVDFRLVVVAFCGLLALLLAELSVKLELVFVGKLLGLASLIDIGGF